MSMWISLSKNGSDDEKDLVIVERFQEGGTQPVGGTTRAEVNVTYNYHEVTKILDFSFWDLKGKLAGETIRVLEDLVEKLGIRAYKTDYWAPTPGNAGVVCALLLSWAKQHPDAVWHVSG